MSSLREKIKGMVSQDENVEEVSLTTVGISVIPSLCLLTLVYSSEKDAWIDLAVLGI